LCSAGFDSAGFDRCAISFVHQQTWQIFQIQINQQQPTVCDFQAWRSLPDGNCRPVASSSDRVNRD
jgi:hypothetical protein